MAGETILSPRRDNIASAKKNAARYTRSKLVVGLDTDTLAATETQVGDIWKTAIKLPSNALVHDIAVYNDDLDTNCSPALTLDVGVEAAQDYTSVTSGTATKHAAGDIIDPDLLVDGSTELQAANTQWTSLVPDSATFGPDDADKMIWELLGYDDDPHTDFYIVCTFAAGAGTGAEGDIALRVQYSVD